MSNLTQTTLAFIEGAGLTFSPCILPVLPLIFAASSVGGKLRPLQIVAGFILSFTIFSLISRQLLTATGVQLDQIQTGAFFFLLLFGIIMLVPAFEAKFASATSSMAEKAQQLSRNRFSEQVGGGLLMGALIGIVWTPCAGPILAVALLQVIQAQTNLDAVTTILAFSIGAGLPMLLIGYFGQAFSHKISALTKHTVLIRRFMGALIVIFALMGLWGFNLGEWVAVRYDTPGQPLQTSQNKLINGLTFSYPAPEIKGIKQWINSPALNISDLKGKVVLVDFWTYSCINCIRTLPHVTSWYHNYKKDGLVIIGVHSPEFAFERQFDNVKRATEKFGITYPVALDNNLQTWDSYNNHYWPAHYLIDRNGRIVYIHFGEGNYDITENNIRYLLNLDEKKVDSSEAKPPISKDQTPETYLGTARGERQVSDAQAIIPLHSWILTGEWLHKPQYIETKIKGDKLSLHYQAKKVFLVMASADGKDKEIQINAGSQQKIMTINHSQLYEIVNNKLSEDGIVTITGDAGIRLYAFTFES